MSVAVRKESDLPNAVTLDELIRLKPAGETIRLSTPRIRAFAAGGHLSAFRGRGIEFDESRPYQEGDDLRTIDWRVTARSGKPHTKVFREERNRPVILWLDLSASMLFATRGVFKAVLAARAAALIGWSAIRNGDQLGGLIFSESGHEELRPRLGRKAALRLLQRVVDSEAWQQTEAAGAVDSPAAIRLQALQRMMRVARPGSQAFLISDFAEIDDEFERCLRRLAGHTDVQLIQVYDPIERELPPPGRYRIDVGSKTYTIDTSDSALRARYRQTFADRRAQLERLAGMPGVRWLSCATVDDPSVLLRKHFALR